MTDTITLPLIVSDAEWRAAHEALMAKEKAATRARDALAAERRRQPMVEVGRRYVFEAPRGNLTLLDLFDGRRQLIVYHFMFGPGAHGWPEAGCPGCSMFVDQVCHLAHLHARDTSFALVSIAPLAKIEAYRKRMGWTLHWVSSAASDFNRDFGVTTESGESFGLSVFLRDSDKIYRSSFTRGSHTTTYPSQTEVVSEHRNTSFAKAANDGLHFLDLLRTLRTVEQNVVPVCGIEILDRG